MGYGFNNDRSYHDVAQICLNGHMINDSTKTSPEFSTKFCKRCGQETISQCPNCSEPIKGRYHTPGYFSSKEIDIPSYCHNCGTPYPWTKAKLEAAIELISEEENLTADDKAKVTENLPNIMADTPKTTLAATRIKKVFDKMSGVGKEGFKQLVFEITIESAKHLIWPS